MNESKSGLDLMEKNYLKNHYYLQKHLHFHVFKYKIFDIRDNKNKLVIFLLDFQKSTNLDRWM